MACPQPPTLAIQLCTSRYSCRCRDEFDRVRSLSNQPGSLVVKHKHSESISLLVVLMFFLGHSMSECLGQTDGPKKGTGTSVAEEKAKKEETKKPASFDPLKQKGMLNSIAEPLSKLLKFKRKGEVLTLNLPASYSEGSGAFQQIRTKARGGGGGHGSGSFWTQYISSQTLGGRIQKSEQNFGRNKVRPEAVSAEFLESTDDLASLEIQSEDESDFIVRIGGGLNPFYLQVIQSKEGFVVQEVNGHSAFTGNGSSFEDFCRKNPDYVQSRLVPVLKHYGIASPITRFNSVTRDYVLALLSPADNEKLKQFKEDFKDLESTKFDLREAASKKLTEDFDKWKDVIRFAAGSDQFSIEVKSRLQKLIKEKSSEEDRQLLALVAAGDLVNDSAYLVWLLGQTESQSLKTNVATKLKSLTNKDLGTDANAWNDFLNGKETTQTASNSSSNPDSDSSPKLAQAEGYLPQMAAPTADLLRLAIDQKKLKLDRKFWADQFNGEPIKDLVSRLQTQLEKSNLPKRWLNSGGGYGLDYVFHEHVLFEHIQTVIPPQTSPNYYSYGNLSSYRNSQINRVVEQPHLFLQLHREKQESKDDFRRIDGAKNKPNVFRYTARERRDSHMELNFVEQEDSSIHLTISGRETKSLFQLFQSADGKISCHFLEQGILKTAKANNAEELVAKNEEFLKKVVYPVFARFGIQIPDSIGGPLEIKNAPKPKSNS